MRLAACRAAAIVGSVGIGSSACQCQVWKAEVAANQPQSEDRCCIKPTHDGGVLYGVWDGHGGSEASEFAHLHTLSAVAMHLRQGANGNAAAALIEAFRQAEMQFKTRCWELCQQGDWEHATVGACALVMHVSADRGSLTVANAGDCRAVLAVLREGVWQAIDLSRDHNSREVMERQLVSEEHPGESDLFLRHSGDAWYIKGRLQPTRGLGDYYLKDARFNCPRIGGAMLRTRYTPPYVKWQPEVKSHEVQSGDQLVILATDGLWDELSSSDAVKVAGQAIGQNADPAKLLVQVALAIAAEKAGMSIQMIDRLGMMGNPFGYTRRHVHDDISVIVVDLGQRQWGEPVEKTSRL